VAKEERKDAETTQPTEPGETPDVEAHGAKEAVGIGLAAAALLGAGAVGVKTAFDDDSPRDRVAGALTTSETTEQRDVDLNSADVDGDGYLTLQELEGVGLKWRLDELQAEGLEVTSAGLSAAGSKHLIELVDKEGGFALEGDAIVLKMGVDPVLDESVKGAALEWSDKLREIDRDQDGYAGHEELEAAGYRWNVKELEEAGYAVSAEELAKAGYKMELELFDKGGFPVEGESVMLKVGEDELLDSMIKGERG
jgi:hypothetical protein